MSRIRVSEAPGRDAASAKRRGVPRGVYLVPGFIALLAGVLAGLARLGVSVPDFFAAQAGQHAALMVSAFFGTVIGLERAVALGHPAAYLGPVLSGLGGLALLAGVPGSAVQALFVLASLVMVAGAIAVLRRQVAEFTVALAIGALCWLLGNLAWLGGAGIQAAIPWWLAFLVITIAGERLELTRFLPVRPGAIPLFRAALAVVLGGAACVVLEPGPGLRLFAAGLLILALWLLNYDIARRNIRESGLVRYIALCLLSGYVWLGLGAALGIAGGLEPGSPMRDSALHAVALGFVFAMVFGHAPIIFPAVARVRIPYRPLFYVPLALLHASLALRVAGVVFADGTTGWQQVGAVSNAIALLVFIVTMAASAIAGRRRSPG